MKQLLQNVFERSKTTWRFRWVGLGSAWAVFVLGLALVCLVPNSYRSHAQIYVDTTSILRPLLQGIAVSSNAQDQADVVRHALTARPTLEKVVHETALSLRARNQEQMDKVIKQLQTDLDVTGDSRSSLYTISYHDHDARLTQSVVQVLLDSFVEDALGANRSDTGNAQRFLSQQVADYAARLSASEQRLAEFKKRNIAVMPDQRGDHFTQLQAELATLEKLRTSLAVATNERDTLRRKMTANAAPTGVAVKVPTDREIQDATSLDAQIRDSKRQLDELLLKFTDKHPDVIALRDRIARLEARRQAELGNVRQTQGEAGAAGGAEIDPVMQDLEIRLNAADVQVASLQTQVDRASERVADLRKLVATTPEVEAELAQLNRDYGVTKAQYEALLQRLESARISGQADKSEEIKFKVLEAPRVPLQPYSPPRLLLVPLVLVVAIAFGVAVAFLLDLAKPVFITATTLSNVTGAVVLGAVSRPLDAHAHRVRRASSYAYGVMFGFLLAAFAVSAAFSQVGSRLVRRGLGLE